MSLRQIVGVGAMVLVPAIVGGVALATAKVAEPQVQPVDRAVLAQAPTHVTLNLAGATKPHELHLGVTSPTGTSVSCAAPAIKATTVEQQVCITQPGTYRVAYHVAWPEGRQLIGTSTFTVGAGSPTLNVTHEHGDDPFSKGLTVVAALCIAALIFAMVRPRSARQKS